MPSSLLDAINALVLNVVGIKTNTHGLYQITPEYLTRSWSLHLSLATFVLESIILWSTGSNRFLFYLNSFMSVLTFVLAELRNSRLLQQLEEVKGTPPPSSPPSVNGN